MSQNIAAGIFATVIIVAVLGITGTSILDGAVESSSVGTIEETTYVTNVTATEVFAEQNVSGVQSTEIPEGVVNNVSVLISNHETVTVSNEHITNGNFQTGTTVGWTVSQVPWVCLQPLR